MEKTLISFIEINWKRLLDLVSSDSRWDVYSAWSSPTPASIVSITRRDEYWTFPLGESLLSSVIKPILWQFYLRDLTHFHLTN